MLAKNNSYFSPELCVDGHYIITGYTNDSFCNERQQLTDITYELYNYLKETQGFDAVIFLDGLFMLGCYDQTSFDILSGKRTSENTSSIQSDSIGQIAKTGPYSTRKRRTRNSNINQNEQSNSENSSPNRLKSLNMKRMSLRQGWEQVTNLLQSTEKRCALVLSDVDSIINSMDEQVMAFLGGFQAYRRSRHSIIIYVFRENSSISNFLDSDFRGVFARLLKNRIETDSPEENRVISLRTPNSKEIENLLGRMRLNKTADKKLNISYKDFNSLAETLAASCARQKWGLTKLLDRLETYISENPGKVLSMDNWNEFTGEQNYLSPMNQLEKLVGLDSVKDNIRKWYFLQDSNRGKEKIQPISYSRFSPTPNMGKIQRHGHGLNILLKGGPGTGKTTIARIMGGLYYDLSLLPQGQLIECSASDLVSENVGRTASLVRERVQEAMGGVLFIDEAYSLATNQHGREAINQLVNDMSTYKGQFAVILAGYPKDMDDLMRTNEGLKRRFPNEYILPDYSPTEMKEIFKKMVEHDGEVCIGEELEKELDNFCKAWVGGKSIGWGNAGEAEKLLLEMKKKCSERYHLEKDDKDESTPSVLPMELTKADIPDKLQYCLKPCKNEETVLEEINNLIGLPNVKKFLKDLSTNIRLGAKGSSPGNYIFSGAPGTGKTMVARKMGELLGHLCNLPRKTIIECKAADLLNGSVQLSEMVQAARGGILFIDEAHQLEQNESGHNIIRELVPLIEDPEIHSDTGFICAGYTAEMKKFLAVDQGLSRRFPVKNRIRFNDYSAEELVEILKRMVAAELEKNSSKMTEEELKKIETENSIDEHKIKKDEIIKKYEDENEEIINSPEFKAYLSRSKIAFEKYLEHRPRNFGNGGFIRETYLPESILARSSRLNKKLTDGKNQTNDIERLASKDEVNSLSYKEKNTLTEEDIPKSFLQFAGPLGKYNKDDRDTQTLLSELYGKDEFVAYVKSLSKKEGNADSFFDGDANIGMHYSIATSGGNGGRTAIRIMAHARKEYHFLENDSVVIVGKSDLEAGFVGQTSIKAQNVVEHAIGGTLVISYPSSMLPKNAHDNSFGPEALGVIINAMSEHINDLCVVFLDTQDGLEDLFKTFPSVRSQLSKQFIFEDLSHEDMFNIFKLKTKDNMIFEDCLESLLPDFFLNWVSDRGGLGESAVSWGNGREIDQLINELIQQWKIQNGETKAESLELDGREYNLYRRYITKSMFPKKLIKYLVPNRVISDTAMQKLESMTGLMRVKKAIKGVERKIRMLGQSASYLYCYVGNPGVGKTTVAKLMGGILKATGALSQGHVITRTARQMSENISEFDKIIKLAKNGILFIDEAHQLADSNYGRLVIKKLLTVLEDTNITKNTCIILAGYPTDMEMLFATDAGLASRFGTADSIIEFDDYTPTELLEILDDMAKNAASIVQIGTPYPIKLSEKFRELSLEVFKDITNNGNRDFGNARFVRNYLHDSVDRMLERIEEERGVSNKKLTEDECFLTEKDIPRRYKDER